MRCAGWVAVFAIGCAGGPEGSRAPAPLPVLAAPRAQQLAPASAPLARTAASQSLLPDSGEPAPAPATSGSVPAGPRVGGTQWFTWIYSKPDTRTMPLGYLRPGSTLPLAEPGTVAGHGCAKFVRVPGDGFVCASRAGTLDTSSRYFEVGRAVEPGPGAFPYEYALSVGTHMFTRVPTREEYARFENGDRDRPLRGWDETHDELAVDEPITANGPIPEFLRDGGSIPSAWGKQQGLYFKKAPRGVMVAYTRAFEAHGEVWVLSSNQTVVPALGLKRYRRTSFRGLALGGGVDLPIAWVKSGEPAKWRLQAGRLAKASDHWALRTHIALTGASREQDGISFLETKEPNTFVNEREVSVARRRKPPRLVSQPDEKWVHSELGKGLLTLYRGERPVFVTLASPGVKNATPAGLERVESKHHVSTLTTENGEPKKFWIADAPWVVYFKRPFAIHSAFWHEDFGVPRSYGCINVSPQDGQTIFDFVDPPLPAGWGSAQGHTRLGRGTWILVER